MNPPSIPPPFPPNADQAPASGFNENVMVTSIEGAEGMTRRELIEEIGRGGRVVTFPYTISALIITFRRTWRVVLVKADGSGAAGPAWTASLLTLALGWWGIPWGPIYSIYSLLMNAWGGTDVTSTVLQRIARPDRIEAALKLRQRGRTSPGIWALRAFVLAIPVLVWMVIVNISGSGAR